MRSALKLITIFYFLTLYGCVSYKPPPARYRKEVVPYRFISVAVGKNISEAVLTSKSLRMVIDSRIVSLPSPSRLMIGDGFVEVDGKSYRLPVRIQGSEVISFNGKTYYGDLIIRDKMLINVLPLEEYLKGVLSQEVSDSWPIEALKAQAVVSRTYAVRRMVKNREKGYDIEDTEMHQKFEYTKNNKNINRAISETKDVIILYKGEPIEAFYHSCSGGITENSGDVFQLNLPYLRSIPDPYSRNIDRFIWQYEVSEKEMRESLKTVLDEEYRSLKIRDVRIQKRTGSGRVSEFMLYFENGKKKEVRGNTLRLALDPKQLKSLLIQRIQKKRVDGTTVFIFSGKGYGHGVGMSQWGAKIMAEYGFRYRNILTYYYRGTRLGNLESMTGLR